MTKYSVSNLLKILAKRCLDPKNNPIRQFAQNLQQTEFNLSRSSALLMDSAIKRAVPGGVTEQFFVKSSDEGMPDRSELKDLFRCSFDGGRSMMLFTPPGRAPVVIVDHLEAGMAEGVDADSVIVFDPQNPFEGDDPEQLEESLYIQTVDDFLDDMDGNHTDSHDISFVLEPNFDVLAGETLDQDAIFSKITGLENDQPLIWFSKAGSDGGDEGGSPPKEITLPSGDNAFPGISRDHPLVIVSLGNMAKSILDGLQGLDYENVHIVSPARGKGDPQSDIRRDLKDEKIAKEYPGASVYSADQLARDLTPGFILIGAKPKMLFDSDGVDGLAKYYEPYFKGKSNSVAISVLAGTSIETVKNALGSGKAAVARVMPNLAASVNESASAICFSGEVTQEQQETVTKIFNAIGSVTVVPEKDLDVMTAIAGCGPGVVFAIMEAYLAACQQVLKEQEVDLDEEQIKNVLQQVFFGATKMANEEGAGLTKLRQNVCSAEGMTVEIVAEILGGVSLAQLEADKSGESRLDLNSTYLTQLIKVALDEGIERGKEMEKQEKPKKIDVPTSQGWKH